MAFYDPEAPPPGQPAPTYELDFRTLTDFPAGWVDIAGGFVAYDINSTRPGGLWARSNPSESAFRGKSYPTLIPASEDFCCIWRPWVAGGPSNFSLMAVFFEATSAGLGIIGWTGRHSSYGTGLTYSFERYAYAGTTPQWNMDKGMTLAPAFMGVRRVGGDWIYGASPDGSYWQEWPITGDVLGTNAISVHIQLYGSEAYGAEGGLSVFRLWHGAGMGVQRRSGGIANTGSGGTLSAFVPTYISPGETFTVPVNRQAAYALPIINDGVMIIDGNLVMVD